MLKLREYEPRDGDQVNSLVHSAWQELAPLTPEWNILSGRLGNLVKQASVSEVIVAEFNSEIVGAVGYVGPHQPKPDFFQAEWPIVRLLSVAPEHRGLRIGRCLMEACIAKAKRDNALLIALHTTPVMKHAQQLYRSLGFQLHQELPSLYGMPYVLLTKQLNISE